MGEERLPRVMTRELGGGKEFSPGGRRMIGWGA